MSRTQPVTIIVFLVLACATLLSYIGLAQTGSNYVFYYSSGIVHTYPVDPSHVDPWIMYSAPHVYRTLFGVDAEGNVESIPGYTVASPSIPPGEVSRLSASLAATLASLLQQPGRGTASEYYHIAISRDLTTSRCGPAKAVETEDTVSYYFGGRLLFAAVRIGHDARSGLDVYAYFSLQYDGLGLCSDRLVDGPDAAILLGSSIIIAVFALEGFRYSRKSLETIFSSEARGTL